MAAQKKSFSDALSNVSNPALQFISSTEALTEPDENGKQTRFVFHPQPKRETKSRRVQLLLYPSTYEKLKKAADAAGASVNAYLEQMIDYITEEKENE